MRLLFEEMVVDMIRRFYGVSYNSDIPSESDSRSRCCCSVLFLSKVGILIPWISLPYDVFLVDRHLACFAKSAHCCNSSKHGTGHIGGGKCLERSELCG
jgi:hypothetical protein